MPNVTCNVVKGLNDFKVLPAKIEADLPIPTGWTNINWSTFETDPDNDPIDLVLRLLLSANGDGANSTTYDILEPGVGLGIPSDMVDIASFTKLKSDSDYDVNFQRVFFHFTQPEPAKDFIEQELCKPFGFYIHTGNDGKLRCVRPRHPQKFYIGGTNNAVALTYPVGTTDPAKTVSIPIGVYDAFELARQVQVAVNNLFPQQPNQAFFVNYSTAATSKFSIDSSTAFAMAGGANTIWNMLGWSTPVQVNPGTTIATNTAGTLLGAIPAIASLTLTQDDMSGVRIIDNRDDRIASVAYLFDYDVDRGTYRRGRRYVDQDRIDLVDSLCAYDYTITSRGLISAAMNSTSPVAHYTKPPIHKNPCLPVLIRPKSGYGVDADTWSQLYARSLLDRYKDPPLKFRARLKWKWNTLELGDVVRINYTIPGVFVDFERNSSILSNRLFEIVELHPNFDGSLDATFLGHRYVSYA